MDKIYALATKVFCDEEKAHRWMKKPCRALGGAKPSDLLNSQEGTQRVEDELVRIMHGVYI